MPSDPLRTIDLWFCEFQTPDPYQNLLSSEEQARANRFRFPEDREFFIYCRSMLRRLLSRYLSVPAQDITFKLGPRGKPRIPSSDIVFNTSHSGTMFACAISTGAELGADIEQIRVVQDIESMAKHFFAPNEVARLLSLPPEQKQAAFFECWTRKEAVIKATGEGVYRRLDSFEVSFGPAAECRLERLDSEIRPQWQIQSFQPKPDYIAALASSAPWNPVSLYRIAGTDLENLSSEIPPRSASRS